MLRYIVLSVFIILFPLLPLDAQQKELNIVVSSPRGVIRTLDQSQTIFATFSEPMVALQAVPANQGTGPIIVEPNIKGKYRWMGSTTVAFIPANPLPYSTLFTVKIPASTLSLKGSKLSQEFTWTFETPRPRIIWTSPSNRQTHLDTNTSIVLRFNQPVDPQVLAKCMSIAVAREGKTRSFPPFSARQATVSDSIPHPEQVVIVTPSPALGLGAEVTVDINNSLFGKEGPLTMAQPYSMSFSTYGELKFLGVEDADKIFPQSGIKLRFSNGVTSKNVLERLTLNPKLTTREAYYENTLPSEIIEIPLPLQAESTYTGILRAGLVDQYGNVLRDTEEFSFFVRSFLPFVRTRTGIGVLEAYESHKFPVSTMNMDSFRVQMGAVTPDRIVPVMRTLTWDYYSKMEFDEGVLLTPPMLRSDVSELIHAKVIPTKAKPNTVMVRPLDFDDVLGKDGRGVVFVQVDDMNPTQTAYLKSLVQVTSFGITSKFSPISNLIWVTNLRDASPVPGASVEIRNDSNKVLWTGTTDDKGLVKTPGWGKLGLAAEGGEVNDDEEGGYYEESSHPRQWVIVRKGNEIAFTSSDWDEGIQPYRFDVHYDWNPQPEKFEGTLFTDRGLYKANERVDIKGIVRVRTEDTWKLASALTVKLTIKNSRQEEIYNEEQKLSPFGSFATSLTLKPSAPLGYYSMTLDYAAKVKGKKTWRRMVWGTFRVEAFRPAEFEVIAKFDKKEYIVGDTVSGFMNAKYLYGAPMKNEEIRWRLSASRTGFNPPGLEEYFFGKLPWLSRYQEEYYGKELQTKDTILDAFGSVAMRSPIDRGVLQGTVSLMLEGEVTSPSRQTLAGRATVIVHGGEFYAGIRPSSTFVKTGSAMTFSVIAASPESKLLPDQRLEMKIYQRIWHSVRKAETGGRFSWNSVPSDTLIDSSIVMTGDKPAVKSFTPKDPGFFYIQLSGSDSRGNAVVSQTYFYASGSTYVAWERTNDDRIELVPNRKSFKPGETASIIIKNPYEKAAALVTVEREGILKHFTTTVTGSAPVLDIPITSDFLPNVYVSVVLLQGRTSRPTAKVESDVGRPSFKVGYVALSVNAREKQLKVAVESWQKEYRPGDTVEAIIRVNDVAGNPKRAEVALSVVDLGVLNLINYRLPDPFDIFYRERGLAVVTTETRMHIIEQRSYDEKGQEVGGGGAYRSGEDIPDADGIRKEFRASAYWNPTILTDDKGVAVVKFKLPDNLTSFKMMAVAETKESEFGYGENSFAVNKPLLLQPSLPRFARVGDSFKSGVVIMNYSDRSQTIKLVTAVFGLRWDGGDTTMHHLEPGQAKEVLFNFTAEKIGSAKFVFRAYGDREYDGMQWIIPVNAPRLGETVASYESLFEPAIEERIVPPLDAFGDVGEVEFSASSTAMTGLSGGISYLFHYPYGCLEQRASAILPMILAKDLVDAFKFDVLKDKDYRAVVTKTLDEIPLFQQSNGGFSYWKNEGKAWSYISAYAVYTLLQAQRNGYSIDTYALAKGIEYLKRVLHGDERDEFYSKYYYQCTRALILYNLALAGNPDHGYMENLYNERQEMALFAKAYLLKALHAAKGKKSMQDELERDLTNHAKISPTSAHFEERQDYELWWCFDSDTRTTALIMQALIETQPENSLIPKVVRCVVDQQKVGRWRTTQENIYVVDALATYLRAYEKEEPSFRATISTEGKTILNELFKGRSFRVAQSSIPLSQLTPGKSYPITFTKDGTGRLYYGMRMNYYPKGETQAKEEGFSVLKTIESVDGGAPPNFVPGTILRVTVTVASNQARHFVVVDDPVPAGCEIVNTSFETTASNLGQNERQRDAYWYEYAFHHVEKYDDHVLLFADYFTPGPHSYTYLIQVTRSGSYQMPATRAEGMYEPEVFGQTASGVVVIRQK